MFIKWKGAGLGFFLVSGLAPDVLIFRLTSAFLLCPGLWSVLENTKQWEGGPLPRRHLPVSWVTEPRGMKPTVKLIESRADVSETSWAVAICRGKHVLPWGALTLLPTPTPAYRLGSSLRKAQSELVTPWVYVTRLCFFAVYPLPHGPHCPVPVPRNTP